MHGPAIEFSTLPNGAAVVTEAIGGVASAGIVWLAPAGTARDPADRVGLAPLHAELLYRGAGDHDARGLADAFDALGAQRSASAGTFATGVRATCLGTALHDTLGLIAQTVLRPRMDAGQLEPARSLCLQGLDSLRDDPHSRVMVNVRAAHKPAPLDRSTYGTRGGLEAITADEVAPLWAQRAAPAGSIIAAAGAVDHAAIVDQVAALAEGWTGDAPAIELGGAPPRGYHHEEDATDQVHIAIAHDAPSESSDEAWLERVATAVLSGGMSGRLFTELREKRSLCYSVHASYAAERDSGQTTAYIGTTPERAQESVALLLGELRRIGTPEGRVSEDEFGRAVVGLKSRLVFSGESSGARAGALARDVRKLGAPRSLDELAAKIDSVTLEALNAYLAARPLGRVTVASIGPSELDPPLEAAS